VGLSWAAPAADGDTVRGVSLRAGAQLLSGSLGRLPSAVGCHRAARAVSPSPQVAETCQLAVRRLEWLQEHRDEPGASPYHSIDPAPPAEETDVAKLRETLLDESRTLFDRYRAMFALRNLGGRDAVLALADGKGRRGAARRLLAGGLRLSSPLQRWLATSQPGLASAGISWLPCRGKSEAADLVPWFGIALQRGVGVLSGEGAERGPGPIWM